MLAKQEINNNRLFGRVNNYFDLNFINNIQPLQQALYPKQNNINFNNMNDKRAVKPNKEKEFEKEEEEDEKEEELKKMKILTKSVHQMNIKKQKLYFIVKNAK